MEFQPVIMAGGRGSRMTDLTNKMPKPLLPVGNMPLVWYPIQFLQKAGFEEAIIIVQKSQRKQIERILIEECTVKMKLEFVSIPDDEDWGTADSLRHIKEKVKADILVLSCDLLTDVSLHYLADIHRAYDSTITMLFNEVTEQIAETTVPGPKTKKKPEIDFIGLDDECKRVLFMGNAADFEETIVMKKSLFKKHPRLLIKSKLSDAHMYIMKKWVVDLLQDEKSFSTIKGELIPYFIKKGSKAQKVSNKKDHIQSPQKDKCDIENYGSDDKFTRLAMEMSTWNDHSGDMEKAYRGDQIRCYSHILDNGFCMRVNTLASYCEANRIISKHFPSLVDDIPFTHPSASVAQRSQVGSECMVGDGVSIADKVGVKRSMIGKHCSIAEKVKITNSIIMDHVTIKEGCNIQGSIICDNVHIGEKSDLKDSIVTSAQNVAAMSKSSNEVITDMDNMMHF